VKRLHFANTRRAWRELTRVPLATMLDYLGAGQPLSEFLEDFPTVTRERKRPHLRKRNECQSFIARCRVETIVEGRERDPLARLALEVQAAGELYSVT